MLERFPCDIQSRDEAGSSTDIPRLEGGPSRRERRDSDALTFERILRGSTTHAREERVLSKENSLLVSTVEKQEAWRRLVLRLTCRTWDLALVGQPHVTAVQGRFIAYVGCNSLLFLVTGSGECDEMGLYKILENLIETLKDLLGNKLDAKHIYRNYGKVCLVVDLMFDNGEIASLEKEHILAQSKLKKLVDDSEGD